MDVKTGDWGLISVFLGYKPRLYHCTTVTSDIKWHRARVQKSEMLRIVKGNFEKYLVFEGQKLQHHEHFLKVPGSFK